MNWKAIIIALIILMPLVTAFDFLNPYEIQIRYIIINDFPENVIIGISGNNVYRVNTYEIHLMEKPLPLLKVDNINLYYSTQSAFYISDYATGSIKYKIIKTNITAFDVEGGYAYLTTPNYIHQVNLTNGLTEKMWGSQYTLNFKALGDYIYYSVGDKMYKANKDTGEVVKIYVKGEKIDYLANGE